MNFREFVEQQKRAGTAEVSELTELQHAKTGEGPWALYIFGRGGYHTGKVWFRKGQIKYPDEEITAEQAKERVEKAIRDGREVRICDGGDMLVFHSENGAVIYPEAGQDFWKEVLG